MGRPHGKAPVGAGELDQIRLGDPFCSFISPPKNRIIIVLAIVLLEFDIAAGYLSGVEQRFKFPQVLVNQHVPIG